MKRVQLKGLFHGVLASVTASKRFLGSNTGISSRFLDKFLSTNVLICTLISTSCLLAILKTYKISLDINLLLKILLVYTVRKENISACQLKNFSSIYLQAILGLEVPKF